MMIYDVFTIAFTINDIFQASFINELRYTFLNEKCVYIKFWYCLEVQISLKLGISGLSLFLEYIATVLSVFHKHTLTKQFTFSITLTEEKMRVF